MKQIKNFEGLYSITKEGKVFSHKGNKFLTPFLESRKGAKTYYKVTLCNNSVNKTVSLHRIIAEHFVPNPQNKKFVDHINRDKTDNKLENLRWVSMVENNRNKSKTVWGKTKLPQSTYKGVHWDNVKSKWVVRTVDKLGVNKNLGRFDDEKEAAKAYNDYIKEEYKDFSEFNYLNEI